MAADELRALLKEWQRSGELDRVRGNPSRQRKTVEGWLVCMKHQSMAVMDCAEHPEVTDWREKMTPWGKLGDLLPLLDEYRVMPIELAESGFDRERNRPVVKARSVRAAEVIAVAGVLGMAFVAWPVGKWVLRFVRRREGNEPPKPAS